MSSPVPDDDATSIRPAVDTTLVRSSGKPPSGNGPPRPRRAARRRPRRRVPLLVLGGLAALLVLYLLGALATQDRLPRNAVVSGVDVGGLSTEAARARLTAELGPRASEPLDVRAGEQEAALDPTGAGLALDVDGSVAAAGGGSSLDPRALWRALTGGSATQAVVSVDQPKLRDALRDLSSELAREPADARIEFDGADPEVTRARDGLELDQDAAAQTVADGLLAPDPVQLPTRSIPPVVTTAEAEELVDSYARPAVSGPVTVRAGSAGSFDVTPRMIAAALTFAEQDGTLVPDLDVKALRKAGTEAVAAVETTEPRDATVEIAGGKPRVVPAVDGTTVTAKALGAAVEPVLTEQGGKRRADVELSGARADFTTADAEKLGVREVTGEFTTYFPYAEYRNVNIGRAAELIDGTLLRPGETFSLNEVLGERTRANGFTEGLVISGGKFQRELGGGVSQSATTTYNAMFFAGLEDVQHQPHTLYIDRYPPGREATVNWPDLDLKFTNDTDHGVLVQAGTVKATSSQRGSITVRMWSTRTWDEVESTTPARSNFTTGRTVTDTSASCEPQAPAQGFDVSYARLFYRNGEVAERENFSWRYAPTDRISCG